MIKQFRVWDKTKKEYDNDVMVGTDGRLWNTDRYGYTEGAFAEDYIIEWSTGIKDKNGVEIFEGDSVNFTLKDGVSHTRVATNCKVVWDSKRCAFRLNIPNGSIRLWDYWKYELKVIEDILRIQELMEDEE